ncbi:DUF5717 family protein [Butyrivibrio sp. AE3006]|uniref:DUF5717 family protein n=1 Tax=Butyrivibrio sp. AE3006 TaxID=1280673 RepID=UPI00040F53CF|nr:DUF5717 family protein [Butyrivibrio sp. AE3006]
MKSVIDRLLKGQFEYNERVLSFSIPRLELNIKPGEVVEGSFTLYGPADRMVQGIVGSLEMRMEIITAQFSGAEFEVAYRFDGTGLCPGDVIKGDINVISNQGEYQLPFVVNVEISHVMSSMGAIRNMFHFVNLAKTNWDEAKKLFYSKEFIEVFAENDTEYENLYRGLSAIPMSEANMEEFLVSIGKKQPISYIPDRAQIEIDNPAGVTEHTVMIARNGWGFTDLKVIFDGEFISADRTELTDHDFLGNNCYYKFYIDAAALHDGNNFGAIILRTAYNEVKIPVTVRVNLGKWHLSTMMMDKKKLTVSLVKLYEDFRSKKIGSREWLTESGKLVNKMNTLDPKDPAFRLYTAQYLITASRESEGKWILDSIGPMLEDQDTGDDTLYCYYLYLTTLISREEDVINEVSRRIEGIFSRNSGNWRIAWLLLYISENYSSSPTSRWLMLEEQFEHGCRSPIIYLEALGVIAETPTMLSKMGDFEIHVLEYGVKKGFLQPTIIEQIVYLGQRERSYNDRMCKLLMACYDLKGDKESLEAVCSLLIKGNRTDKEAFIWYARGVDAELHITRLFEYYMAAIYVDEDGLLPCEISRMVLMFFSYQSDLEYEKNAILYRYVHEHREEYPDLFDTYRIQIEKFLLEQIDRGRVNRDLGYLYKHMITDRMVDASNCEKVMRIIYSNEIKTKDPRMKKVIVVYDKLEEELSYSLVNGAAFLPLYGSDYAVFLEDGEDHRYAEGIPFNNEKLMLAGHISQYVQPFIQKGKESLELFLCELEKSTYTITMENVGRYKELADSGQVRKKCRTLIRECLIRFYYDNDFERQLSEYLDEVNLTELTTAERGAMFELMVMSGNYDKAYQLCKRFGMYKLDPRIVMRMCGRLMDKEGFEDSEENSLIAFYAFKNSKYDEQLLSYLVRNYNGTLREMRDLWKAAASFSIDSYDLAGRMLTQMLYTGAHIGDKTSIFRGYVMRSGGGDDLERAFLAQEANDYFVHSMVTDNYIFERIGVLADQGCELNDVCKMAYLKRFTEPHRENLKENSTIIKRFLSDLLEKKIYFAFFTHYTNELPKMQMFCDKTFIEYRTTRGTKCIVHYVGGAEDDDEYHTVEMQEVYPGIYEAAFVLFFGEQLQYYITEEGNGGRSEKLTESGMLTKSDIVQEVIAGRYSIINDIMIGKTLQDYETVNRLLSEYYKKRFMTNKLFRMK